MAQQLVKLPVMLSFAGVRFQPIDADEVAARLAELSLGKPAGLVPDMGGPRIYPMADLFRGYLRAAHKRRPVMPVWQPGQAARAFRNGANLAPDHAVGRRTWEDFLAERVGAIALRTLCSSTLAKPCSVDGTWLLSCDDTGFKVANVVTSVRRAAVASWIGAVLMIIYSAERSVRWHASRVRGVRRPQRTVRVVRTYAAVHVLSQNERAAGKRTQRRDDPTGAGQPAR